MNFRSMKLVLNGAKQTGALLKKYKQDRERKDFDAIDTLRRSLLTDAERDEVLANSPAHIRAVAEHMRKEDGAAKALEKTRAYALARGNGDGLTADATDVDRADRLKALKDRSVIKKDDLRNTFEDFKKKTKKNRKKFGKLATQRKAEANKNFKRLEKDALKQKAQLEKKRAKAAKQFEKDLSKRKVKAGKKADRILAKKGLKQNKKKGNKFGLIFAILALIGAAAAAFKFLGSKPAAPATTPKVQDFTPPQTPSVHHVQGTEPKTTEVSNTELEHDEAPEFPIVEETHAVEETPAEDVPAEDGTIVEEAPVEETPVEKPVVEEEIVVTEEAPAKETQGEDPDEGGRHRL